MTLPIRRHHVNVRRMIPAVVVLCAGCLGGSVAGADCQWEGFQELGYSQKQETLRGCSPDEQVDLYLKWSFATMPANYDLAETMAALGPSIVPAVLARIERSEGPWDQLAKGRLIFVLVLMQDHGHYAVAKDEKLMGRLEHAVASMTEPELKKAAEETLGWLKRPRS